jgi:hypothetical protein
MSETGYVDLFHVPLILERKTGREVKTIAKNSNPWQPGSCGEKKPLSLFVSLP